MGLLVLLSAVDAQRRRNTTLAAVTTEQATSLQQTSEATSDAGTSTSEENMRVVEAVRLEIERRRQERLQRIEKRRETLLRNLENMSDRKREYELRRQERLGSSPNSEEDRRQEMETRRAGRIPAREQDRVTRLRQERLGQSVPNGNQNEVDGPSALLPAIADLIRHIVLIEESNGNVKLVDLSTEEGRDLVSRVTERVQSEDAKEEVLSKLKIKLGQL